MQAADPGATGDDTAGHPSRRKTGSSLPRAVRVDFRQVVKLSVLFSVWILLPLTLLIVAYQRIAAVHQVVNLQLAEQQLLWGGLLALLALAMAVAIAFTIARQQALAKSLEQAIDNVPMLVSYVDADQRYLFNNRAYLDTYGITPKDLYGRQVREILGEDSYRQIQPHLDMALAGQRVEFEMHSGSGSNRRDLLVIYVPDEGENGEVRGLYALVSDITLRKQSERREKEHLLELTHLARLASMGEITAEIAHQINQPLAAIAMFSSAAQRTLTDEHGQLRDWLETINAQAKRASEVIQRLRRFIHPGKIESSALNLNETVREVAALVAYECHSRQVALDLELTEPLPPVRAAGILIEQAIYILVRNAIQAVAGKPHAGQVTIRTYADADRVRVEILDNGPEMDAERVKRMFEPFDAEEDTGPGMSLMISRAIVSSYDGDIVYKKREEGGAMFQCFLPKVQP